MQLTAPTASSTAGGVDTPFSGALLQPTKGGKNNKINKYPRQKNYSHPDTRLENDLIGS